MVKIRLKRLGAKKLPRYRVVAVDSRGKRDGRVLENLGWMNPQADPPTVELHKERVMEWLAKGAVPSETVASVLKRHGIELPKP
ncbi:30S ribosomal protein S16 [bacterium]|nr:30S ribosomal protein S16 [candidate division CSSED10-310 bacterium]